MTIRLYPLTMVSLWMGFVAATAGFADDVDRPTLFPSPQREFRVTVQTWQQTKSKNVVLQKHEYTCGAASMGTILRYYFEDPVSEERILTAAFAGLDEKEVKDREKNGLSMEDLSRAASKLNYAAAVIKLDYTKLAQLPAPVVVRLIKDDFKHFVVFRGELDGYVFVADPIRGNVRMPRYQFVEQWDGNVLAVVRRGMKPRTEHPLQVSPNTMVTPQNLAARRALFDLLPSRPQPR